MSLDNFFKASIIIPTYNRYDDLKKCLESISQQTTDPANFEITVNLLLEDDLEILFNRLIDVNSFDLYVSTADDVFKLETCVITNGTINIERLRPLSLSISGEASKLLTGQATEFAAESITVLRTSASSRTYNLSPDLTVALGGTDIHGHLVSMSIELQNEIDWIPWKTVNNALVAGNTMYPTQFNLKGKVGVSGNAKKRRYYFYYGKHSITSRDFKMDLKFLPV